MTSDPGVRTRSLGREIIVRTAVLTVMIEVLTVVLRFGFALESRLHTASTIGRLTFGLRFHHGYVGLLFLLLATAVCRRYPRLFASLTVFGLSLALSDAAHHFLVLWPVTGSPQFDFFYPDR